MTEEKKQKFLKRVKKLKSGCWQFLRRDGTPSKQLLYGGTTPQRFSWLVHNGPLLRGNNLYLFCDTKNCVNPEHLSPGTIRRIDLRWTQRFNCLSEDIVRQIRASTESVYTICKQFGVSGQTVYGIRKRRTYKHVV